MKKFKYLILPLALAVTAGATLAGCAGEPVNQGPEVRGVKDLTCLANTAVDLLDGVAALDLEDGDITPDLKITVTPEVAVEGGYVVFPKAGEYEVCYEVQDSLGKLARTTVGATVTEREVYMDNMLTNGFALKTGGSAKALANGLNGGAYAFKVTGNEIAEDVKLTRTYTLITGNDYTFKYYFDCNVAGRIKLAADGKAFDEGTVTAGANVLTFNYELPLEETADGETATDTVEIELWFGGLDGDLEVSLTKAEASYIQKDSSLVEMLPENFSFVGKTHDRFDGAAGNAGPVDDGKGVYLEVTTAGAADWRGGVFVETGLSVSEGETYVISYDVEARDSTPFFIKFQNKQWDEAEIAFKNQTGHVQFETTITNANQGSLWIYIASGNYTNKITLTNLSVKKKTTAGAVMMQTFAIGGVTANSGTATSEYGKIIYDIPTFGNDWGNNELKTPGFALSGAAGNFVIQFRAKASSPVSCVFVATLSAEWNTFVWKQLKLSTEETTYSIRCDDKAVEGVYSFLWQFGTAANAIYSDVKVEISDIKICNLSELEG